MYDATRQRSQLRMNQGRAAVAGAPVAPSARVETVIVYRVHDLPRILRADLPAGSEVEQCLFFLAEPESSTIARLRDALPEPLLEHVNEGVVVSWKAMRVLVRSSSLRSMLELGGASPDSMEQVLTYGFHAGPAEEIERWLRDAGVRLIPASEILRELYLFELQCHDGTRPKTAILRIEQSQSPAPAVLRCLEPGLFVLDLSQRPSGGPHVIHDHFGGAARVFDLRGGPQSLTALPPTAEDVRYSNVACMLRLSGAPLDLLELTRSLDQKLLALPSLDLELAESVEDLGCSGLYVKAWFSAANPSIEVFLTQGAENPSCGRVRPRGPT